jgi:hypothetical protein
MRRVPRWHWGMWVMGASMAVALLAVAVRADDDESERQIRRGFQLAEQIGLTLNLTGKNRALVGLGSYIVNAHGGCNDCHTWPSYVEGGDPFQGQPEQINAARYLAGGRVFISPAPYPLGLNGCVVSANITPFEDGKPAGLTFEQFQHLLLTGEDHDDTAHNPPRLLQVMPWPVFANMTIRDMRAVYEFLSAIPAIAGEAECP